ncbi:MAG: S-adenosylmethionine:tRNA ribosyltransferase-isomerase [Deltaproteobacteria bacterium]|nr:S-adenosylmethionine:tRNA ribosyltransferase-isomerase [Deltaproteobacteria bacterium]
MKPAKWMSDDALDERLLHIDPRTGRFDDKRIRELPELLHEGDLFVMNDAATLPASLRGARQDGSPMELRLVEAPVAGEARAVLFGSGDWRDRTEERPAPAPARAGERFQFGHGLEAVVLDVDSTHQRLLRVKLLPNGDVLWAALYAAGTPVQYSHLAKPLQLWAPQTSYAAQPWAVEMPSAGRPLRWELLLALRRRGVRWARLTHAAGLSSTGDDALDAALPLRERYEIPEETLFELEAAEQRGARVMAVGTTVVRALEGCATERGRVLAGAGETSLRIGPGFVPRVVHGLFTGMHEPTASHFALLHAFAPGALLRDAHAHAEREGYLGHEFGDSALILPSRESI